MFWKRVVLVSAVLGAFAFSGCTHKYTWHEYDVGDRVPSVASFNTNSPVAVINGQDDDEIRAIGHIVGMDLTGTLHQLTEAVVDQLEHELKDHNVRLDRNAGKQLIVKVEHPHIEQGMWMLRGDIDVEVRTGGGAVREYKIRNSTPGAIQLAFDGAIGLAVVEILNDQEILTYLMK